MGERKFLKMALNFRFRWKTIRRWWWLFASKLWHQIAVFRCCKLITFHLFLSESSQSALMWWWIHFQRNLFAVDWICRMAEGEKHAKWKRCQVPWSLALVGTLPIDRDDFWWMVIDWIESLIGILGCKLENVRGLELLSADLRAKFSATAASDQKTSKSKQECF